MEWVPRREYEDRVARLDRQIDRNAERLERLSDQVAGLRADLRVYAKVGGLLVTILGILAPFIATRFHG